MRLRAEFPFVDAAVNVVIEVSDEGYRNQSADVIWEYPICRAQLMRGSHSLDFGCLSLMELLGFLHLPLRRSEYSQIDGAEIGNCFLSLHMGSFTPQEGAELYRMILRDQEEGSGDFCIAFSEDQAEQWAVSIWEIENRLMRFRRMR